jgi:chaperonin GroEL
MHSCKRSSLTRCLLKRQNISNYMAVEVSQKLDLQNKILLGVNKLANAVTSTLGPGGRNVLIHDTDGTIRVTKDGVSVAKAFTSLQDPIENTAVQLMKTVSQKAVDFAGDGTTTATLLAQSIIVEGFKAIETDSNPIQVKVGVDKAVKAVVSKLKEISEDIGTEDQIMQVAQLSANGDVEIAKLITQALDYVGDDGAVSIEESKNGETYLEKVEGMVFERGYKTPYFSTDNTKMEANLLKPYILITDGRISGNDQVVNFLNFVAGKDRSLLIIAEDIDSEALSTLIVNKGRGILKVCAVKAPDFGDRRLAILEDIAIMTGGVVISETKGLRLSSPKMKNIDWELYLGQARSVTVTANDTTIVEGQPKIEKVEDGVDEEGAVKYKEINPIETRLLEIKAQLDKARSPFERENLQQRLSKLTGGVAIINVGGASEVELKEKKDRVDDALHATKSAILEGVVPGGGMALINCESALDSLVLDNKDQVVGREIVRKVLYAPFTKILANAGIDDHTTILDSIKGGFVNKKSKLFGKEFSTPFSTKWVVPKFATSSVWNGFNVKTGEYVDLKEAGVLDPTKVTRTAIENAASVAGVVLTTTAAVYELPTSNTSEQQEQYE